MLPAQKSSSLLIIHSPEFIAIFQLAMLPIQIIHTNLQARQNYKKTDKERKGKTFPCSLRSYPGVLTDVSTSDFLILDPQFTCLRPGRKGAQNIY